MSKKKWEYFPPKYNPADEVWYMSNNEPRNGMVYAVIFKPRFGGLGPLQWEYLVWGSSSFIGVSESRCWRFTENQIFETKEELIASL